MPEIIVGIVEISEPDSDLPKVKETKANLDSIKIHIPDKKSRNISIAKTVGSIKG